MTNTINTSLDILKQKGYHETEAKIVPDIFIDDIEDWETKPTRNKNHGKLRSEDYRRKKRAAVIKRKKQLTKSIHSVTSDYEHDGKYSKNNILRCHCPWCGYHRTKEDGLPAHQKARADIPIIIETEECFLTN